MNVLITGASGFIGHALCNTLAEKGHIVKGAFRSQEKLLKYKNNMDCVAIGEIGPNTNWTEALRGVDVIIHLAAIAHVIKKSSVNLSDDFRRVTTQGTERLADMAANAKIRRLIFLSTVKVNGEQTIDQPFVETDLPHPHDPYAISKWEAEQALYKISKETGLEVVILRPPLVYGTGVKANFLRLLQLVDRNIPLPFLNLDNRRSLIYLGNLVDAIVTCCVHPNAKGETFLVSDGENVSTPELIRMIASAMNKKAKLFPCPESLLKTVVALLGKKEELDRLLRSLRIDSSKIRKVLNWTPPFSMRDGIAETVKWYINR